MIDILNYAKKNEIKLVVRLKTDYWHDENGCYMKKNIRFMKRKSHGYNVLKEDCGMIGASEIIPNIVNIDSCADGLYTVIVINESRDWETGHIEDYDYKLVKYDEQ